MEPNDTDKFDPNGRKVYPPAPGTPTFDALRAKTTPDSSPLPPPGQPQQGPQAGAGATQGPELGPWPRPPAARRWDNAPEPLRQRPQWLMAGPNEKGELKVPTTVSAATGWLPAPGSSTNRATWMTFADACAAATHFGYGIGYVLADEDPFTCIDFDVKNAANEADASKWTPLHHIPQMVEHIADLDSYTEISPSGQGWHVWVYAKFAGDGCKRRGLEVYCRQRFMTVTGHSTSDPNKQIEDRADDVVALVTLMRGNGAAVEASVALTEVAPEQEDSALLERMRSYANADKLNALWDGKWATWEEPGMNGQPRRPYTSQSEADMALMGLLCLYSKANEQCRRMFLDSALGQREKAQGRNGPKYMNRMLRKIRGRQAMDEERRKAQLARNTAIGEGADEEPLQGVVMTLDEMCEQLVFVRQGSGVAWFNAPRINYSKTDAPGVFAGCIEYTLTKEGKTKSTLLFPAWRDSGKRRKDVETLTFDPASGVYCVDVNGSRALNLWRPIPMLADVPDNAAALVKVFLAHVYYLIPDQRAAERFLDWLAHIEQFPGVLPHWGYIFIALAQGVGRNWLSGVLARMWPGHVAVNFDLVGTLKNGFNEHLSRKLMAVVDEINEGGSGEEWEHQERLKKMHTEEQRRINKKYGLQWSERNCCRWLVFSNHLTAMPLTDNDRRWEVIRNPDQPMPPEYYVALYAQLDNPAFIASVRSFLQGRNLSNFNPGMPAHRSEAKAAMIAATKSDERERAEEVLRTWGSDAIDSETLGGLLYGSDVSKRQGRIKHRALEANMQRWQGPPGTKTQRIRFPFGPQAYTVWVLRNHGRWVTADVEAVRAEVMRGRDAHVKEQYGQP